MKIVKKEVKAFQNELYCECGGIMKYNGMAPIPFDSSDTRCSCLRPAYIPKYEYMCEKCRSVDASHISYPYISHEVIDI